MKFRTAPLGVSVHKAGLLVLGCILGQIHGPGGVKMQLPALRAAALHLQPGSAFCQHLRVDTSKKGSRSTSVKAFRKFSEKASMWHGSSMSVML